MYITNTHITAYAAALRAEERSSGTIEKYARDLAALARFLQGRPLTQESVSAWKAHLLDRSYAPCTINGMLAAVNGFCRFYQLPVRMRFLKLQRKLFREERRELSRGEYSRLLAAAEPDPRTRLLLETICSTGIRVSEVRYITVEAARAGRTDIRLKGKIRTILLPGKLCRRLLKYAGKQKIASGEIFLTEGGKSMSRQRIWRAFKRLCAAADVAPEKVFPHNLRHLFAVTFYRIYKDIARLADLLGHSSIETTRVYLVTSGREHSRQLNAMRLLL